MDILHPNNLESMVLSLLQKGEVSTTTLLTQVRLIRKKTTKQGFYAALRRLKKQEAVVVYKGTAALHTSWIKDMHDTFENISRAYTLNSESFDLLSMNEKESVSYIFSTVKNLDIFWGHSQNMLAGNSPRNEPIYAYDPHYWFYIARRETEKKLLHSIVESKRQFLMTVGANTVLDKSIKSDFKGDYLQYNIQKMFEKPNYYVTVIGDYITEVFLDPVLAKKIGVLYQEHEKISPELLDEFNKILNSKAKNRVKISRNKTKADMLKKRMAKNFYILKRDSRPLSETAMVST